MLIPSHLQLPSGHCLVPKLVGWATLESIPWPKSIMTHSTNKKFSKTAWNLSSPIMFVDNYSSRRWKREHGPCTHRVFTWLVCKKTIKSVLNILTRWVSYSNNDEIGTVGYFVERIFCCGRELCDKVQPWVSLSGNRFRGENWTDSWYVCIWSGSRVLWMKNDAYFFQNICLNTLSKKVFIRFYRNRGITRDYAIDIYRIYIYRVSQKSQLNISNGKC